MAEVSGECSTRRAGCQNTWCWGDGAAGWHSTWEQTSGMPGEHQQAQQRVPWSTARGEGVPRVPHLASRLMR